MDEGAIAIDESDVLPASAVSGEDEAKSPEEALQTDESNEVVESGEPVEHEFNLDQVDAYSAALEEVDNNLTSQFDIWTAERDAASDHIRNIRAQIEESIDIYQDAIRSREGLTIGQGDAINNMQIGNSENNSATVISQVLSEMGEPTRSEAELLIASPEETDHIYTAGDRSKLIVWEGSDGLMHADYSTTHTFGPAEDIPAGLEPLNITAISYDEAGDAVSYVSVKDGVLLSNPIANMAK